MSESSDLEHEVAVAAPGATITLAGGVYALAMPLEADKRLTIRGAGASTTIVTGAVWRALIIVRAQGVVLEDLTIQVPTGQGAIDGVLVERGSLVMNRCAVTGATESGLQGGSGVLISGGARAQLHGCRLSDNYRGGAVAIDDSELLVEDTTSEQNVGAGIQYFGASLGAARRNTLDGNKVFGVWVDRTARPILESNVCSNNGDSGIAFFETSSGIARANRCTGNRQSGIRVADRARPIIESNTCSGNGVGIFYLHESAGVARENICNENDEGILIRTTAGATFKANECSHNRKSGIVVDDGAVTYLLDNRCYSNAAYGIEFRGTHGVGLHSETTRFEGNRGGELFRPS